MEQVERELILPLVEESLSVSRRVREVGRVRVSINTLTEPTASETTVLHRLVDVERVKVDREVMEAPPVREEGRTLVIPVLEEVVVTTRRLMLREEVRLTFRDHPTVDRKTVVLRRQTATVERLPPLPPQSEPQPEAEEVTMSTQTITALFDDRMEAERAVEMLVREHHLDRTAIELHATAQTSAASTTTTQPRDTGFMAGLREMFLPEPDRVVFEEGVRRGGTLMVVRAAAAQHDAVVDALEHHGAVDLDTRESEWRASGWTGETTATMASPTVVPAMAAGAANRELGRADDEERISLVEETLRVGKRQASGGRVRVRSYVVETPVHEQVTLREEHVDVQRRAVDRPMDANEAMFQERVIEATEMVEEAVVGKDARVREEIVIRKTAEERVETISDTVRRTEVEVERDSDEKVPVSPPTPGR